MISCHRHQDRAFPLGESQGFQVLQAKTKPLIIASPSEPSQWPASLSNIYFKQREGSALVGVSSRFWRNPTRSSRKQSKGTKAGNEKQNIMTGFGVSAAQRGFDPKPRATSSPFQAGKSISKFSRRTATQEQSTGVKSLRSFGWIPLLHQNRCP